jgi:hypothetical protein
MELASASRPIETPRVRLNRIKPAQLFVPRQPLNLGALEGFLHSRAPPLLLPQQTIASASPAMTLTSSLGTTSGAGAGDGPGKHERGRPLGGLAVTPPIPRKRGRPQGSRNKKTLAALAAAAGTAAATRPFGTGRSTSKGPAVPPPSSRPLAGPWLRPPAAP